MRARGGENSICRIGYPLNVARREQVGAYPLTSPTQGLQSDNNRLGIFPPDKRKTPPAVKLRGLQVGG